MRKPINRQSVIRPKRLRKGDQIGVISPAGAVKTSELLAGIELLESWGFSVRLGKHVSSTKGYLAGEDEERLEDLHAMFENPDIRAVICSRGGYGTMRLLPRIRYDLIGQNPKILVGFSDITALLLSLYAKTGLVTFHGPVVRGLGAGTQDNGKSLFRMLTSEGPFEVDLKNNGTVVVPGRVQGLLLGGNLSLLCHLMGTPFLHSLSGTMLFVEEKGEALYRVDRMLTHLMLSGELDGLAGLVGGGFEDCGDPSGLKSLFKEIFSEVTFPVVLGLPVGHGPRNVSLPIGMMATLDTERMTLCVNGTPTID